LECFMGLCIKKKKLGHLMRCDVGITIIDQRTNNPRTNLTMNLWLESKLGWCNTLTSCSIRSLWNTRIS
jgi:hypothetical protein